MIYGVVFGIFNMISFIYSNNKLQHKYYCELSKSKDKWKISPEIIHSLNDKSSWFPLNHNYRGNYTKLQKKHYLMSQIMLGILSGAAIETYLNGYTKLHLNHTKLIYLPIDVLVSLLINNCLYYYYHRAAHHPLFYKYIHSYHHAELYPKPFDSLIGHPIDHTFSAIWQTIPMFIYPMHLISFLSYSSFVSLMGIWDHSGIKFEYLKYRSIDHHIHHRYPSKNFSTGLPFLLLDVLQGTQQYHI